jgi:hypothetical protein
MEPDLGDWRAIPGETPVLWAEERIGQESPIRSDYLKALKAAGNGDVCALLALHRQHVEQ